MASSALERTFDHTAALIFDLDGTLVDTAPDLICCIDELLAENDRPAISPHELRSTASHGANAMICHAFSLTPEATLTKRLESELIRRYRQRIADKSRLFPGMAQVLDIADAVGIPWGVVTNKPQYLTEPLLDKLGLSNRATVVVSGDTLAKAKPDPLPMRFAAHSLGRSPSDCIAIGDARRDIESASSAGAKSLVALFGYLNAGDRPTHWGAHALIRQPEEIIEWITIR
ncbi:HAD family hydrolase [Halorhodospira halochloris]|uniref:HAD family hydrolase n=1 Tax=Halorhodospira halochloris TaxID=1052 RepID=UPI001EE825C8|nr:HAD-IA family hydrolase [Halorhodospira halochloris]MCG5548014.1 HAD-IA family hydrolase [Halorhodospira halochloris]